MDEIRARGSVIISPSTPLQYFEGKNLRRMCEL